MPSLIKDGAQKLQAALDSLAKEIPGNFLTIASAGEILFDGCAGNFDMLDGKRQVTSNDVVWFASTTKLLTAVCYLQLVDRGVLSLETKMAENFPALAEASSRVLSGFDDASNPTFEEPKRSITLAMMLNQTSGFGMEFGEKVGQWKKVTDEGKGFVNSCKIENLIHTPLCNQPGELFEYGNSAEWLGLILPSIVGMSTEDYLQANVLMPLGMLSTTFYPFGPDFDDRLMPLRYGQVKPVSPDDHQDRLVAGEKFEWQELNGQMDLLTLPRKREHIEYPVAGGGIYSKTSDYVLLLQYLLAHKAHLDNPSSPEPKVKILSDASVRSLFEPTLPTSAQESLIKMYNPYLDIQPSEGGLLQPGDANWSTAMAIYKPQDGRRRSGWGRLSGSVGWGGAAGTEYFIDPSSGIAVAFTTQMLPGSISAVKEAKKRIEKAIYAALE